VRNLLAGQSLRAGTPSPAPTEELEKLRFQIADLQARLQERETKARAPRKRKRSAK
jgi:hypothetical protein